MNIRRQQSAARALPWLVGVSLVSSIGCAEPDDADSPAPELSSVRQALDNDTSDPNNGKTCYVDGPLAGQGKGKMENGFCCVQRKEGETCYLCTDAYECQIGNSEPACLTVDPNVGEVGGTPKPGINIGAVKAATAVKANTL